MMRHRAMLTAVALGLFAMGMGVNLSGATVLRFLLMTGVITPIVAFAVQERG